MAAFIVWLVRVAPGTLVKRGAAQQINRQFTLFPTRFAVVLLCDASCFTVLREHGHPAGTASLKFQPKTDAPGTRRAVRAEKFSAKRHLRVKPAGMGRAQTGLDQHGVAPRDI